jgi:putative copper resistance protein D
MDWLSNGVMFAWYGSVLTFIGAIGAVRVLAPLGAAAQWSRSALRIARVAITVVLLALIARLWLQTWQAFGGDQPLALQHAAVILNETPWGDGWMWQMAATLLAWPIVARASADRWQFAMMAALVVGGTVGQTGHAAGSDIARLMIIVHGLHVLAAGFWLGTLALLMFVTRGPGTSTGSDMRGALAAAIGRFSPGAIVAVAVLAISGLLAAWEHVGSFAALYSPYGSVLIAKAAAFGAAALCGLYNWRVVRPSLSAQPLGVSRLRVVAALELTFGFIALALTSVLTSMEMPGH